MAQWGAPDIPGEPTIEGHAAAAVYACLDIQREAAKIIAEHSGQSLEKVSKDMERDYFMTPEEAQEYGIIDRVISHR